MPHNDNPAGRAYLLLHELWQLNPQSMLRDGWRSVLGVEDAEEAIVLKRMASVFRLPDQIAYEASLVTTIDPDPVLAAIPSFETVIKEWHSNRKMDWFRTAFDKGSLTAF